MWRRYAAVGIAMSALLAFVAIAADSPQGRITLEPGGVFEMPNGSRFVYMGYDNATNTFTIRHYKLSEAEYMGYYPLIAAFTAFNYTEGMDLAFENMNPITGAAGQASIYGIEIGGNGNSFTFSLEATP